MKPTIHADMRISEILHHYPQTRSVFEGHGLGGLVSEDGLRALAPFLTLATALRSRLIQTDAFLRLLQEVITVDEVLESPGLDHFDQQGELTLLALMPCGLKVPFGKAISTFIEQFKAESGSEVRYAVEGNLNQELSYYPYINTIETIDELPDIIVSADFNAFYGHKFYNRFVATGLMTGYGDIHINQSFSDCGIVDEQQHYTMIGVNPLVIVANLDEVGDRPLPTSWADVLDPMWDESLTLRGNSDFFCHAVLLPLYQKHGAQGLKQLAANVLQGMHPAQMVKQIDSGAAGALYVMPEFFAHRVKHQERIKIIWPEDGALASPVTLQVKSSKIEQLKPILDYLTGPDLARALVNARFPVPHAEVEGDLQQLPLLWVGWDQLRQRDLLELNAEIDSLFLPFITKPTPDSSDGEAQ